MGTTITPLIPEVKVSKDPCECGAMQLEVDFNRNDTPLPRKETFHKGCVFCDEVLSALVQEGYVRPASVRVRAFPQQYLCFIPSRSPLWSAWAQGSVGKASNTLAATASA